MQQFFMHDFFFLKKEELNLSLLITFYFFSLCDYLLLSKQSICNDPYLIHFQYI